MTQPVDSIREALSRTHSVPFERSQAMPSGYYISEDFRVLEEEHIFRKEWVCLGRADEIARLKSTRCLAHLKVCKSTAATTDARVCGKRKEDHDESAIPTGAP